MALLGLSLAACRADEEHDLPRDVVWNSPHFAYHTRTGEKPVCENVVVMLEKHFSAIQSMFDFDWPDGRTIHYYKFMTQADFAANSPCPAGAAACTDRNNVYSYQVFEQHELVHAYLWPFGLPPPVIAEGTAVALVCNRAVPETPPLSLTDAMQVHEALADQRVYDTGARLVRHLLEAYGPEAFLRFYARVRQSTSVDSLDRIMRSVFDVGAEDAWAAALGKPWHCPPSFPCSRDSVALDGAPVEVSPTCGFDSEARTFTVVADSEVALQGAAFLSVGSCDPVRFSTIPATRLDSAADQIGLVQLPPGRYYLDIRSWAPTSVQMVAASVPSAGAECAALQPLVLPAGQHPDLRVSVPPGAPEWMVKLRFEEPRLLTLRWPAGTALSVCRDCSSSLCQPLSVVSPPPGGARWDVSWQGDYVLRIQGPASGETTMVDVVGR
jgi:hypothetical protein